ncbi:BON domain-containing protein [Flavobacterium sp.]|uniref:BON domain-containing protein n=1 Tax=Flavobacterium sp. TaxID=239 RepID=UPI00286DF53A|nr:BON domain-containing protein [Flavobacterium sp.]
METNQILKEKVENNLDANLAPHKIQINVFGNNVTLKGVVKTYDEKDKIEEIAWNTFGVISVNNELSIENEN